MPDQIASLRQLYGQPEWLDTDIGAYERFCATESDTTVTYAYAQMFRTAAAISVAVELGYVEAGSVNRILDFGSESGDALLAVDQFAAYVGARVVASEIELEGRQFIERAADAGVYACVDTVAANGLDSMRSPGGFDLIVVSMFAPSREFPQLPSDFMNNLDRGLSIGGVAVVHSDRRTMAKFIEASDTLSDEQFDVKVLWAPDLPIGHRNRPHVIVKQQR